MKKIILFIFTLVLFNGIICAQKVEKLVAEKIAKEVYKRNNQGKETNLKDIITLGDESKKDTLIYIVHFEDTGFAIISGQFAAPPVLGYCMDGNYDTAVMPPGLLYLIEKYKYEINSFKKDKKKPTDKVEKLWSEYLTGNQMKSYSIGSYLLNTTWSQQSNFNQFCPAGCPAGCTAVAMAQILRCWACRIAPTGYVSYSGLGYYGGSANIGATTYNWLSMSNSTANTDNALLIYHAGVSCYTHYNTDASSSTPGNARDGFVYNWGISPSAEVKWRISHLNNWQEMLEDELDLERPLLYSASSHSWVIDGYNSTGQFHCNWGWSNPNYYNGWFTLGNFDPPGEYGPYNQFESAIFNVVPIQNAGVATPQLSNQSFTYGSAGYILSVPTAYGATSYQWTTNKGSISGTGTSVTLYTDCTATVQVRAYNSLCNIYSPYASATITINYGLISGNAIVCSSNAYSVPNLPSGSTVVWSLSPHPSAIQLQNNIPSTNQCLVSNPYKYPAVMTLTATITLPSGGTAVLTKTIESDTNTTYQAGSYYQQACAAYNHSFPSQSGTLNGSPVFLYPGCTTEVTLSQMTGRTISFVSGSPQPLSWNYSSSNSKLYLQLTTQSGPYIFSITGAGACNTKTLVFFAYSGYSLLLSPNPTSGETTVTIEQTLNEDETLKSATTETGFDYDTEWEMEVYSPAQNLKEKQAKVKGKSTKIQTSGWQEGVYVVRVKYKNEILTDKLVVKK
jgi:hypothetical protein